MRKIVNLVLVMMLVMMLGGCKKSEAKPKDDIYIVFTSDVHCGVDQNFTFPALKAYVNDLKNEHENVLLVDCGDYLQGGTIGILSKGEYVVELMNEMGYDIVTYGNHEFDYGMERLNELMNTLTAEKLASNTRYTGSKENVFNNSKEFIIKDIAGVKIGFIGVLTPSSITDSTPTFFMENGEFVYDFYGGSDPTAFYEKIQSVVNEARKQGAQYIVALDHLGTALENQPYDSISLISHTEGIDVVFDGHSHSIIVEDLYPNKNGKDVIVSSVGTKLEEVGTLIIDKEGKMQTMHMKTYDKSDDLMAKKMADVFGRMDETLKKHETDITFDMKITDDDGIRISRTREVNIGDFLTDALRTTFDADVAILNGGGIRSNISAGEVTFGSLLNVMPFGNKCISIYATGQQIVDALEYGAKDAQAIYKFEDRPAGEFGGFLQVSGLRYMIDTSVESAVSYDELNMFNGFTGEQRRVKDVYILQDGEYVPIDLEKTYTLASLQYLLYDKGDGHTVFTDCEAKDIEGLYDIEVLESYVQQYGIDEKYANLDGRITIE